MGEPWVYPPSALKPDPSKPVRIIERKGQGIFIQFYDVEGRLHELPMVLVIFPPEFQELRSQLPLQDFWPTVTTKLVGTTVKQPVDIQDHWGESVVLLPSAARTTSGNTSDIDVGRFLYGEICIDVTAVSGTNPVLDVYIEGKDRYTGKYKVLFAHEGITSVQTIWDTITTLAFMYIRVRWVIGGTSPSFTFSVSAEMKS